MSFDRFAELHSEFPALQRQIDGRPVAFFDGPAGTQVPQTVIQAVSDYLAHHNANTAGAFAASRETDTAIEDARQAAADFLGASSAGQIVFGANMTSLTFSLSRALGAEWGEGDELVVTELDHQANVAPWRRIAAERGLTVRNVPFRRDTLQLDYGQLEEMVGPRTRLIAVGHASNAVGTVNKVRRVSLLAKEIGALCFVDAVHSAPHLSLDVEEIGCDFLVCSAYKFFGPHVGVLWGRTDLLESFSPAKVAPAPDTAPERWESGTLNHEGIVGVRAAIDWIASLASPGAGSRREALRDAMRTVEEHEQPLVRDLMTGLSELPGVEIFGPPADAARTPTVGFVVRGVSARAVAKRLAARAINVWDGDFYASTVVDGLGLRSAGGLVRAGIAPYVTGDDVGRLIDGVAEITRAGE